MLKVAKVLFLCVLFNAFSSCCKIALLEFMREQRELCRTIRSTLGVASGIIFCEFFLSEITDVLCGIPTPKLTSWDQSTWWHNRVGQNLCASFDATSSANDRVSSDYNIVVDYRAVDAAAWLDSHVLSNID